MPYFMFPANEASALALNQRPRWSVGGRRTHRINHEIRWCWTSSAGTEPFISGPLLQKGQWPGAFLYCRQLKIVCSFSTLIHWYMNIFHCSYSVLRAYILYIFLITHPETVNLIYWSYILIISLFLLWVIYGTVAE